MDTSSRLSGRQPEIPNLPGDVSLEQDTLFSQLAETVDAAILIYQGGRHIYANSAAERVTGYSREELTTMDPFLLIYPEDRERVRGYTDARRRGAPAPTRYEVRFLGKDGGPRWMELNVRVIRYRGEMATLITGFDIAERKQSDAALRESEERYRLLFEYLPQPAWVYDRETFRVLAVNAAAVRHYGYTKEEFLSLKVTDLRPPEDVPTFHAAVNAFRDRQSAMHLPFRHRRKDGTMIEVEVSFHTISFQGREARFVIARNVTTRNRADAALRESVERYRLLTNTIPQFVFTTDAEGRCEYISPQWTEYTGLTVEGTQGFGWMAAVHEDDRQRMSERWREALRAGSEFNVEHRLRRADGIYRWFLNRSLPVKDKAGRVVKWFGTATDIEDAKRAEAEIKRLNGDLERRVVERTAQLEAANKELEAFSYSVSHDLRAPLRAMDGFSRILLEDHAAQLDAEGRRLLNVIRENAHRMGQLIDDLLTFSRVSRKAPERSRVDLRALAEQIIAELAAAGGGVSYEITLGDLPPALGDARLIRQALYNLLANAFKFSRTQPRPAVSLTAERDAAGEWIYCVRDNGVGFDPRYAAKLFNVFQRLHGQDEFEGTGVGLAIVQRIIQRHGGRVWAAGEIGRGAAFHFTLPLAEELHAVSCQTQRTKPRTGER